MSRQMFRLLFLQTCQLRAHAFHQSLKRLCSARAAQIPHQCCSQGVLDASCTSCYPRWIQNARNARALCCLISSKKKTARIIEGTEESVACLPFLVLHGAPTCLCSINQAFTFFCFFIFLFFLFFFKIFNFYVFFSIFCFVC